MNFKQKKYNLLLFIALFAGLNTLAQSIVVHDPVMTEENGTYYLFCTGHGISVWSSTDRINWSKEKPVFSKAPNWTKEAVKSFEGHFWAPDIAYYNNQYYLYYSVSAFGKNTSCIGLATNQTLNPNDPDFEWVDQGKIIQSYPGKTNWNAIDPNLVLDDEGKPFLSFGSFWGGLQLVELSKDAKQVISETEDIITLASRNKTDNKNISAQAGTNAIEAPFIFKKNDFYYLFASIDYCCRGENSTYKMIVGRAKEVTGPYLDTDGNDMSIGGGTILLQGDENWHGVGHNSAYTFNDKDYLIFHGYDANDGGHPKLIINEIKWDNKQWPMVKNNEQ